MSVQESRKQIGAVKRAIKDLRDKKIRTPDEARQRFNALVSVEDELMACLEEVRLAQIEAQKKSEPQPV